jgi:hypothetical protein
MMDQKIESRPQGFNLATEDIRFAQQQSTILFILAEATIVRPLEVTMSMLQAESPMV